MHRPASASPCRHIRRWFSSHQIIKFASSQVRKQRVATAFTLTSSPLHLLHLHRQRHRLSRQGAWQNMIQAESNGNKSDILVTLLMYVNG
jgi:hypothetical protein